MLEKQKPDGGEKEATPAPTLISETMAPTTDEDREKELERRLAMLGGDVEEEAVKEEEEKEDNSNNLMSFDPLPVSVAPAPTPVVESAPEPAAAPTAVKPNKSALLARIMAAQERAKQAQMKQSSAAPVQHTSTTVLPAPEQVALNAEQEKEKMMRALSGIVDDEVGKEIAPEEDLKPPPLPPPPQFTESQTEGPPVMMPPPTMMAPPPTMMAPPLSAPPTTTMPPPPSFDIFEQQQAKEDNIAPPMLPPAFDAIENDILGFPDAQAPSAPPTEESLMDNFDGITPMAPPPTYPGEQVDVDAGVFEFDIDGNPLSPEERRKMMEEQRAIMEQIQKQASENKASEAAVRANAFETRMMANQTGGNTARTSSAAPSSDISAAIDLGSIDPAEVEEQRKILEQIEKENQKARGGSVVGGYQSPAIADNAFTSEEAKQMEEDRKLAERLQNEEEEDRKLAERLQNEENAAASDYPARRRTGASSSAPAAAESESWWDSLKVGMGMSTTPEDSEEKRSAEIQVSRPPGSSSSAHRTSYGDDDYEKAGLLGGGNPREARVAESKPLFSCVVDSVYDAAAVAAAGVTSMTQGDDEEVHGVDTTSFLAVPKIGDDRGPSGSYSAIPNDD